jgi:gamma-glutamyltranspeptidase/glutathione hydrolase
MATGSAGGSRIITATLQNLYHVLDQRLSANDAVHVARWHDQLGNVTYFEVAAPALGACSPLLSRATSAHVSTQALRA